MIVTNNQNESIFKALKGLGFETKEVALQGGQNARTRTELVGWNDNIGSLAPSWGEGRQGRGFRESESARLDNLVNREESGQFPFKPGTPEEVLGLQRGGIGEDPRLPAEFFTALDYLARHTDSISALFGNPQSTGESNPNSGGSYSDLWSPEQAPRNWAADPATEPGSRRSGFPALGERHTIRKTKSPPAL
jgi:hypothetical protein